MQNLTVPKIDKYQAPKNLGTDLENFAEVGDNVQKSMDQALEFQNQPDSVGRVKPADPEICPLLLDQRH